MIYECLLKITPFTKAEASHYQDMLRDRNLIVHHGSAFTTKYLEQSSATLERKIFDAFMQSVVIDKRRVSKEIEFISAVAKKMMNTSYTALGRYLTEAALTLDPERKKALEYFQYWGGE